MKTSAPVRLSLKKALAGTGHTIVSLAKEISVTPGAIHNCVSGLSNSARTKQAIVNALRCDDLFEGVTVNEGRLPLLPKGTLVHLPANLTAGWLKQLGKRTSEVRPNLLKILRDPSFV